MTERDTIWGGAAWAALILAAALIFEAPLVRAQSRHDADQAWIRKTIKDERRKAWERGDELGRGTVRHHRPYAGGGDVSRYRRHYHDYRPERRDPPEHAATRVYGFVQHMTQQDRRDCHNGCCPPVENISRDHGSEQRSWNDAQLGWMKAVAVRYGSMYADVQNADARTLVRQCFRSSFGEGWLARNLEAAAQKTGVSDGHQWTCRIIASPCIQPTTGGYETPLKGDKPQQ